MNTINISVKAAIQRIKDNTLMFQTNIDADVDVDIDVVKEGLENRIPIIAYTQTARNGKTTIVSGGNVLKVYKDIMESNDTSVYHKNILNNEHYKVMFINITTQDTMSVEDVIKFAKI